MRSRFDCAPPPARQQSLRPAARAYPSADLLGEEAHRIGTKGRPTRTHRAWVFGGGSFADGAGLAQYSFPSEKKLRQCRNSLVVCTYLLDVLLGAEWPGDGPVPCFCADGSFRFTAGFSPLA